MFFPDEFYQDLGVGLARLAADLEAFFDHQQTVFGDLEYLRGGEAQPQHHVQLRLPSGAALKVLTFPARTDKDVNPDVQFGAVTKLLPGFDVSEYRKAVLRRLGDLIESEAKTDHRFVKFSYDGMLAPGGRDRALNTFEWLLCELRCAGVGELARQSL